MYVRTGEKPCVPRLSFWTAGLFALIAGVVSLFGFEINESSKGRRTGIFWWGLIIFGLALSWLFGVLWSGVFPRATILNISSSLGSLYGIVQIVASLVFLFVGFRMMKGATIRDNQTYSALEPRIFALESYLSQRNYRSLVYLLASVVIHVWALEGGSNIDFLIMRINFVGLILLLILYGPPSMYMEVGLTRLLFCHMLC